MANTCIAVTSVTGLRSSSLLKKGKMAHGMIADNQIKKW